MPKTDNTPKFRSIQLMISAGQIRKMKDLETLYPTLMAKSLGMNHSRYIDKLYHPEEFSVKQLISLANLLEISPDQLFRIILSQSTIAKTIRKKPV